jgi:hypothetical protein
MRVSKEDLKSLKSLSESVTSSAITEQVNSMASAYVAIETVKQLKSTTRNNLIFTILGCFLGFMSSLSVSLITEKKSKEEFQQLNKQLLEVKKQLSNYQMYYSKKDSLQISSKKE